MVWDKYKIAPPNSEQTGLPELEEGRADKFGPRTAIAAFVAPTIMTALGYGLSYLIYQFGDTDLYDTKRDQLAEYDLQWLLLGLIIFQVVVHYMNYYPMRFKERFMHFQGNLRSNPLIYKQATDQTGEGPAIIMSEEGDVGKYNRGNRAIHHFLENSLPFTISLPVSFVLYPFPTFVLLCVFCLGLVLYQTGLTNYGFMYHLPGFMVRMISAYMVTGLLIIAYTKMVF